MSGSSSDRLSEILARTPDVRVRELIPGESIVDPVIIDVAFDSRRVAAGSMFFCSPGDRVDGHEFAAGAVAAGAVALVVERKLDNVGDAVQIVVDYTRPAMAHLSSSFFGYPSRELDVVGITGTNGKTTTAHILTCALNQLGSPTGTIGTLSGGHTTPEAPDLQRRLAEFKAQGCATVAMEVSSHALALDRVLGTRFRVAVFTSFGSDHLDLHATPERYFAAKARLFEADLSEHGVINIDDVQGRLLVDTMLIPTSPFSLSDAVDLELGAFEHSYTWRGQRIRVALGGTFNVMNSLAAVTTLDVLGFDLVDIAEAIATTTQVPGRFERIDAGQDFEVIVDYAHTPDALREVLASARRVAAGNRVIVVFGCGGDRDQQKRPHMGHEAASAADQVVVTSDNPRSEVPLAIINDIIAGVPDEYRGRAVVEPDRLTAIAVALRSAGTGDVVVIAGKGHETTQTVHTTVSFFDDRTAARTLLENMS